MSLDVAKLKKVRELAGGIIQAQCPACAEGGGDRKGQHLRIYPDGRYGCCVHPKDGEHRKRIFALAGERKPGTFSVRLKTPPALSAVRSVKAALTEFGAGTPGTGKTESKSGVPSVPTSPAGNSGTLGTGNSELRARTRGDSPGTHIDIGGDCQEKLKDCESGVPNVPTAVSAEPPSAAPCGGPSERLPYLTPGGSLVIPFDSPERYHWWKPPHEERLSPEETLKEVRAGLATKERMKRAATTGGSEERRPDQDLDKEEYYGDGV